jgi:hypothetical protein
MKQIAIVLMLALMTIPCHAKRTFIPRYTSFISISEQGDSTNECSINTTLYRDDERGLFRVAIIHETLTRERIKYIKRMETATALASFAAIMSGVSTFSSDWKQRYRGRVMTYVNGTLADIYNQNANDAKKLELQAWVENTSTEEIMVADQDRGNVWFLKPGESLNCILANPDIMQLRISNLNHSQVNYITMGGGSVLKEAEVEWEDDDVWIFPLLSDEYGNGTFETVGYMMLDKMTANQHRVTVEEFKTYKRKSKEKMKSQNK